MTVKRSLSKVDFIKPLNTLKTKVGYGGLNDNILNEAQMLIECRSVDFPPQAETYLAELLRAIECGKHPTPGMDRKMLVAGMLDPAMHLKANGGMFSYPLLTRIGARLIEFLEAISELNRDTIEVVLAFHAVMQTVLTGCITSPDRKSVVSG